MNIRDLPLFAATDTVRMTAAARRMASRADGLPRSKADWAAIARCSEHAVSARLSDLRRAGYRVTRYPPRPGTGEVCGRWHYSISIGEDDRR